MQQRAMGQNWTLGCCNKAHMGTMLNQVSYEGAPVHIFVISNLLQCLWCPQQKELLQIF